MLFNKMKFPEIKFLEKTPSSYFIALEAWRRGLNVTFIKNINNYRIISTEKSLFFCNSAVVGGRYGLLTHNTCKDKFATKRLLQLNNIHTPEGKLFDSSSNNIEILNYVRELGYPVVIKPNNDSRGVNVFANLKGQDEAIEALKLIKSDNDNFKILVEKHIEGEDYRVFVVNREVVAAYKRIPANIVGDGKHSIKDLIEIKNEQRKKNPHLHSRLIKIDSEVTQNLQFQNYRLGSVLPMGKTVYLRSKANVSSGGDAIDVTAQLSEHLKKLAIKAIQSIPHLKNGGVDILHLDEKPEESSVLEINSMAQIGGHIFPSEGDSQDVAGSLIDFYFPESIGSKNRNSEMFFNMNTIEKHFETFPESDYTLAPAPVKETIRRMAVLHGDFTLSNIKYKIRNEARRLNLSGFIKSENSEQVEIVLSGEEGDIGLFEEFLEEGHIGVKSFEIKNYDKPITSGFYIDIDK